MIQFILFAYIIVIAFIVVANKRDAGSLAFSSMLLALATWGTVNVLFQDDQLGLEDYKLLIANIAFISSSFAALLFGLFSYSFPYRIKPQSKLLYILGFNSILMIISAALSPVESVSVIEGVYEPEYNSISYVAFTFSTISSIVAGVYMLGEKFNSTDGIEKRQLRFVFIGLVLTISSIIISNLILPNLLDTSYYSQFGPSGLIFLSSFTGYAVMRYRFFDSRYVFGRIIYYFLRSLLLFSAFYLAVFINELLFGGVFNSQAYLGGFLMSLFYAIGIENISNYLKRNIDLRLIKFKMNFAEAQNRFYKESSNSISNEDIFSLLTKTIDKHIQNNGLALIIHNKESNERKVLTSDNIPNVKIVKDKLASLCGFLEHINQMQQVNQTILAEDLITEYRKSDQQFMSTPYFRIYESFTDLNLGGIFTHSDKNELQYTLAIFKVDKKDIFNQDQVSFLENLMSTSAVALDRMKLQDRIIKINEELKVQVSEATADLKKSNDELEASLNRERDMMDILGHELRTPLTIAQSAIIMLQMRQKAGTLTEEKMIELIDKGVEGIKRETKILETILSSTRLENERLPINLVKVDAVDVVNDSYDGYIGRANEKQLELKTEVPDHEVFCFSDRDSTQQIIDNLVSNAIKYTVEGTVTVRLEDLPDRDQVKFSVIDTGEGISEENKGKLGRKFFRINNRDSEGTIAGSEIVRPGGTGIGLYVVFGLVEKMNGKVEIDSDLGKGSTFTIYLPRYSPEKELDSGMNLNRQQDPKG